MPDTALPARLTGIYRYPVKGLTPEHLGRADLSPGQTLLADRRYAIENGPSGFEPAAPRHQLKQRYLMLMRNERLARLRTRFQDTSHTLTIEMEGRDITGTVADEIGVVFQEDATFAWLNVWDNVAFGLRRAGTDGAEIVRRVDQALAFMGLTGFRGAYPAQLSGGMRQRVCIARTLVLRPRLILLDEPFGALDQQTRLLMGEELLRLWRETGATVMLITHALDEAALLSDRVAVMSARPGRLIDIVTTGWPRERDSTLVADPAFGALTGRLWALLRDESKKALGVS